MFRTVGFLAMSAAIAIPIGTRAETPSPLADWQFDAGKVLESLEIETPSKWDVTLGLGTTILPDYPGARQYRYLPSGIVDIEYKGSVFLTDGEGLGVDLVHGKGYRAGMAIGYDIGRTESEDHHLHGLGDISPAPTARVFVEYFFKIAVFKVDAEKALGGNDGVTGNFGAYVPIPIIKDTFFVFIGPTTSFNNDRYMQAYFGVTPIQSLVSHLPTYRATGGLDSTGGGLSAVYLMGDHWLVSFDSGYTRLLRAAAKSPITETQDQYTAVVNIGYHF